MKTFSEKAYCTLFMEAGLVLQEEQRKDLKQITLTCSSTLADMFLDAVSFVKIISSCLLVVLGSRGDTH